MTMNKLSVDKMTFLMTGDKMVVDMMSIDDMTMYKTFVEKNDYRQDGCRNMPVSNDYEQED